MSAYIFVYAFPLRLSECKHLRPNTKLPSSLVLFPLSLVVDLFSFQVPTPVAVYSVGRFILSAVGQGVVTNLLVKSILTLTRSLKLISKESCC